ncbi:MAG: hypothetical protein ACYCUD_11890 [Candidatus Dormibacteria bacterium]
MTIADALRLADSVVGMGNVRGYVVDAIDLWPMGAKEGRLQLTCFCDSCVQFLASSGLDNMVADFLSHPNAWNLLLAENDTHTGISYVDDVESSTTAADLLALSRGRGFVDAFGELKPGVAQKYATRLLQYMRARHDETVAALIRIKENVAAYGPAGASGMGLILLTEGAKYSWTGGMFLDRIDSWQALHKEPPFAEVWTDPTPIEATLRHVPTRSYMWSRGRYHIDAFFDFASGIGDPLRRATTGIGRYSPEVARAVLQSRLNTSLAGEMSGLASLVALPGSAAPGKTGRVGFIGVAHSRQMGEDVLKNTEIAPAYIR